MKDINLLIDNLIKIFDERLISVFMYGSKVKYDDESLNSDINIMVILDKLSGNDLMLCSKFVKKWSNKGNPLPIFMGKDEWYGSSDVYAMEYADIAESHRLLYGYNLIADISVKSADLRFQCEQETKNILMRFRQFYLENAHSPKQLKSSFEPTIKTCNAIFKTILRLNNIPVPTEKLEIIKKIQEVAGLNCDVYKKLLCYKRNQCKFNDTETINLANNIVCSLSELLNYTNNM